MAPLIATPDAAAINVVVNYDYNSSSFFSETTNSGRQARAAVQAAADYFSTILNDTLDAIETPAPWTRVAFGSQVTTTYSWTKGFRDPSNINNVINLSGSDLVGQDDFIVYVGAQSLGGALGVGGAGVGFATFGGFTAFPGADETEFNARLNAWQNAVETRGETPGEFARWGGSISFDPVHNWNRDHTRQPSRNQFDLYSVALHEIGHTLGFGAAEWNVLVDGDRFTGANATAVNGSRPRLSPPEQGQAESSHWADGTRSSLFVGSGSGLASMNRSMAPGRRIEWTELDAAGLADLGWEVAVPATPGDFNGDFVVNAADYTVWRDGQAGSGTYSDWSANYGAGVADAAGVPEPATGLLIALCAAAAIARRRGSA